MSLFKISQKNIHNDDRASIEYIHDEKIKSIEQYYSKLPDKEKKLLKLEKELLTVDNIRDKNKLNTKISELKNEITDIKTQREMTDYLIKASLFFEDMDKHPAPSQSTSDITGISKYVDKKGHINKGTKYKEYINHCFGSGDIISVEPSNSCKNCNSYQEIDWKNNIIVCVSCGIAEVNTGVLELEWAVTETHEPIQVFTYKRKNHFKEWLIQLQAKETTKIPDDLIQSILAEIKKERITDLDEITAEKIKKYIKALKYNKYFEHIPYILRIITNKKPLVIGNVLEKTLLDMFDKIQGPFDRNKPASRKNFLSYSFTLYKFCQLLGRNDLLKYFPLLKSREKLFEQENIWRDICKDLGWEYIKS